MTQSVRLAEGGIVENGELIPPSPRRMAKGGDVWEFFIPIYFVDLCNSLLTDTGVVEFLFAAWSRFLILKDLDVGQTLSPRGQLRPKKTLGGKQSRAGQIFRKMESRTVFKAANSTNPPVTNWGVLFETRELYNIASMAV